MSVLKNEKGLTLIVLAIFMVVLFIISAVVIRNTVNEGAIDKSKDTRRKIEEFSDNSAKDVNQLYDNLIKGEAFD